MPAAKTVLLAATVAVAVSAAGYPKTAPMPPYAAYTVEVETMTMPVRGKQTTTFFKAEVDTAAQARCDSRTTATGTPTDAVLYNFTAGTATSAVLAANGTATKCATTPFDGNFTRDAALGITPAAKVLAELTYAATEKGGVVVYNGTYASNTYSYKFQADAKTGVLVPLILLETTDVNTVLTTYTMAPIAALKQECVKHAQCFSDVCVVSPWAAPAVIQAAIDWVCGKVDCAPLNVKSASPNTLVAHGGWAFERYFAAHRAAAGDAACNFNAAGMVVACKNACSKCVANPAAAAHVVEAAVAWVCNDTPDNGGRVNCSMIPASLPNTTSAHADWAFDQYYQAYKCDPTGSNCDFNGAAMIEEC